MTYGAGQVANPFMAEQNEAAANKMPFQKNNSLLLDETNSVSTTNP